MQTKYTYEISKDNLWEALTKAADIMAELLEEVWIAGRGTLLADEAEELMRAIARWQGESWNEDKFLSLLTEADDSGEPVE
jgi:hypothetical protein